MEKSWLLHCNLLHTYLWQLRVQSPTGKVSLLCENKLNDLVDRSEIETGV